MQASFQQLPPAVQDQLAALTKPAAAAPPHVRVVSLGGIGGNVAGIVFGLLLAIGAVVVGCTDHRWRTPVPGVVLIGALLGAMLVVFQAAGARRVRRSRTRPAFVATPIIAAYVETDRQPIRMHYLKDLKDFKATHHHHNGAYTHTAFHFQFAGGAIDVPVSSKPRAEELLAFLRESPNFLQSWIADGSVNARLAELDWIGAAAAAPAATATPPAASLWDNGWIKLGLSVVAAVVLTGVSWAASQLYWDIERWQYATRQNSASEYKYYLDVAPLGLWKKEAAKRYDDRLFEECRGNAASLRRYLAALPSGAHTGEARARLRENYAQAETAYLEHAKRADPQAAEGMRALLRFLAEQMSPRVTICFAPSEGTDGAAAAQEAKTATGSGKIHGWGTCFTAEQNGTREGRIISVMQSSFRVVLSNDLFDLQSGAMTDDGPRFLVRYRVLGSGDHYTLGSQSALPMGGRDIYPGIQLDFDFSLQVPGSARPPDPDPTKGFRFHTAALPAPHFTVSSVLGSLPADDAVYGTMVETAFTKFEVELIAAYGLRGEKETPPPEPEDK